MKISGSAIPYARSSYMKRSYLPLAITVIFCAGTANPVNAAIEYANELEAFHVGKKRREGRESVRHDA
jgi:hypothetical protein